MIPEGFENLVKKVLAEDPASERELPDSFNEIWNNFAWAVFLDANRSDAEVNYLYDVFNRVGLLNLRTIRRLGLEWTERIRETCQREIKGVTGRKEGLLKAMTHEALLEKATRCILESAEYFSQVSPEIIRERTGSQGETDELVTEIAYPNSPSHIYNIGLTKTILWLQSFGLALHAVPPSRQVLSFAEEDLEVDFMPRRYEDDELGLWSYYFPLLKKMDEISVELGRSLKMPVTPRDVGKAIWYYKSCQSLVAQFRTGLKWKLTPKVLLRFLAIRGWTLGDLADRIGNIDEIDELANDLRTFIQEI
jgi:hypothetical protein